MIKVTYKGVGMDSSFGSCNTITIVGEKEERKKFYDVLERHMLVNSNDLLIKENDTTDLVLFPIDEKFYFQKDFSIIKNFFDVIEKTDSSDEEFQENFTEMIDELKANESKRREESSDEN